MIRFHTTVRKNICYDLFVSRQVVKNATISLFFKKRQILAYGHTRVPKIFIRNGVHSHPGEIFYFAFPVKTGKRIGDQTRNKKRETRRVRFSKFCAKNIKEYNFEG